MEENSETITVVNQILDLFPHNIYTEWPDIVSISHDDVKQLLEKIKPLRLKIRKEDERLSDLILILELALDRILLSKSKSLREGQVVVLALSEVARHAGTYTGF